MPPTDSGERCYAVLFSIHFVLKAERLLQERAIAYELTPIPRALGSACGMAIEFPCRETETLRALLTAAGIEITGLYRRTRDDRFVAVI